MIARRRISALLFAVSASSSLVMNGQEIDERAGRNPQALEKPKSALVDNKFRTLNDFSFTDGVASLVQATRSWREQRNCISCHTTGWGLAAQPIIDPRSAEVVDGRAFAQNYLTKYINGDEKPRSQYGSVEGMVVTAAFLAMSDARSGQEIHPATRTGLDHAWHLLDESGTWEDWLQCNWPPFESDAEFGPTLMLVALGEIKETNALKPQDKEAAGRLGNYLANNPPQSLHAKAMRLWAGNFWPDLLRKKEKNRYRRELLNAQAADGGWSMASLSGPNWKRDGGEGQTTTSEAYATAFATYVLLKTGLASQKSITDQGLLWLQKHQLKTGDWYTRSPRRDRKHYISRAATAFALMALAENNPEKSSQLEK